MGFFDLFKRKKVEEPKAVQPEVIEDNIAEQPGVEPTQEPTQEPATEPVVEPMVEDDEPNIEEDRKELDLKKVAKASKDKKVEMIHMKELLPLTGYMRGGCSPIGMKKKFPTYIEETAILFDKISISAGQRGVQVMLNPEQLAEYVEAQLVPLI